MTSERKLMQPINFSSQNIPMTVLFCSFNFRFYKSSRISMQVKIDFLF